MKHFISMTSLCFFAIGLVVSPASAQCPEGSNPLLALVGRWAFSTQGSMKGTSTEPFSSSGNFEANVDTDRAGNPIGVLTITQTSNIARQETDSGTYQIRPDCSGGTLTLNLSTFPLAFDFEFSALRSACFGLFNGLGVSSDPRFVGNVSIVPQNCPIVTRHDPDVYVTQFASQTMCLTANNQTTITFRACNKGDRPAVGLAAQVQYNNCGFGSGHVCPPGNQEPIVDFPNITLQPGTCQTITLDVKRFGSFNVVAYPLDTTRDKDTSNNKLGFSCPSGRP